MQPYPDHLGLWFIIIVTLIVVGSGAYLTRWWYRRINTLPSVRVSEPPGPSEVTDIIAPLPLLFGMPARHRYDPEGYERPLKCVTCHQPILRQAEFWEVPILNDERPEAMLAVCLQCDSRSPYDKLETS